MIFVLDNYDSFTYNLVQYVGEINPDVVVYRNDKISTKEVMNLKPDGIIISPGPRTPNEAGISIDLVKEARGKIPILGVCLGHQVIGEAFGGKTIQSNTIVHGKSCMIDHSEKGIFMGISSPVEVTRYHSLILDPMTISAKQLQITATTKDHLIMGIQSVEYPDIWGVQFHPESILTKKGKSMIKNFYHICMSKKNIKL